MNLKWEKFEDFFCLYESLKDKPKLIYVIGETHHCYIGSVGGRGGENGLAQRYQQQYIDRAKAIFGSSKPKSQPAFAAVFPEGSVSISDIEPIERKIQDIFVSVHGTNNAQFSPRGVAFAQELSHSGNMPSFLRK